MRNIKFLLVVLGITAITSVSNVFAYYSIASLAGIKVPAHNGSKTTGIKTVPTSAMGYSAHVVDNVSINPSGDDLDVKIRKYDSGKIVKEGDWKILKTGTDTILTENWEFLFQGADFDLLIDSRWYYTKTTTINNGTWGMQYFDQYLKI